MRFRKSSEAAVPGLGWRCGAWLHELPFALSRRDRTHPQSGPGSLPEVERPHALRDGLPWSWQALCLLVVHGDMLDGWTLSGQSFISCQD